MSIRPRVLLADDHGIVLQGIHRVLEGELEIVGEVSDGRALIAAARELGPDVIVLDITMPLLNGLDAARLIREFRPESRIVFLTMHRDVTCAVEALGAGASAYVLKNAAETELREAIRDALCGRLFVSPSIDRDLVDACLRRAGGPLTGRQREFLGLFAAGKSRKEVAAILNVSVKTAEHHKYLIMKQLGLNNSADLTKYAIKIGITSL